MATTTPNFGWPVPTSTDLVKDGATAMEALGDAIDTSMVDLKGGTTGQVLAKASNTDMDFSWVAQDDSNAIQNSIVNAKGDLIGASANDTPAILSVGNNGETLVADSSTATGLRYQVPVQQNPILNSSFQVWQRGTSFALASSAVTYTADRWSAYRTATGCTLSRQATSDTTNLPNIQYSQRVQRDSGNTSTAGISFYNVFESVNSIPFAGKTITLSYYARVGANFSSTTSYIVLKTGTGTDQSIYSGFTGAVNAVLAGVTYSTTWTRYTYTATLATNITQLAIGIELSPSGTAGAADWIETTGWQLEVGSVATPYKPYAGTIQGELAACQRYYLKSYNQATAPATSANYVGNFGYSAISSTATHNRGNVRFPVAMRTTPTMTIYSPGTGTSAKIFNEQASADVDGATQYIGEIGFHVYPTSGTPALGNQLLVHYVASAEL